MLCSKVKSGADAKTKKSTNILPLAYYELKIRFQIFSLETAQENVLPLLCAS